ncbi:thiamine diphosphokinase [Serpentinicella alkaliphila]|uniref:Thiamine diphosphokinase n=1 Tax=Serpentinicella alkaliphila TaxID=1734049 RepID=A0A4V6NSE3_9FIRM|nr:thiamine diphosphokinase [Serpentinicella alkaliphila]QUH26223.1 thiamine diphosphokinase [Serpentinicella alkaliphila]TCQ01684.1 thiamine diphosphokinase [Serpentinicella alkaliphila]
MNIVVITNGHIGNIKSLIKYINECDYIICADGAARYLEEINIVPNMLVGDFDSIQLDNIEWMEEKGVGFNKFPTEKDKTDTELAIDFALDKNPSVITLIGAVGSRVDHSLGNIFLLKKILDNKVIGRIIGENLEMYLIEDGVKIEGEFGDVLSLIPLSIEVKGVTIDNVAYPLNKANMRLGSTWGISNEFKERSIIEVTIDEGLLLVIKTRE